MGWRPELFNSGYKNKQCLHASDSGATEWGIEWAEGPNLTVATRIHKRADRRTINNGYWNKIRERASTQPTEVASLVGA